MSSPPRIGIVSALGRTVSEPSSGNGPGAVLPDVVQTSAAINPGNSGGALADLSGVLEDEFLDIAVHTHSPLEGALPRRVGGGLVHTNVQLCLRHGFTLAPRR